MNATEEKICLQPVHGPVSIGLGVQMVLPLKIIERCLVFELQVPEQVPQLSQTVHVPSTEKFKHFVIVHVPKQLLHKIKKYSLSQGPVSLELPVQGRFPLHSIERCLVFVLQVPEHAPQLSHVVHAPSTENFKHFVIMDVPKQHLLKIKKYTLSQGPVSLELPVQGWLPL